MAGEYSVFSMVSRLGQGANAGGGARGFQNDARKLRQAPPLSSSFPPNSVTNARPLATVRLMMNPASPEMHRNTCNARGNVMYSFCADCVRGVRQRRQ